MKLKKSYILLIVMAIFLLISIGSACASENITDDGDIELADDGENVVLSDTDTVGNVPDDTNQEKINTSVNTGNDTYKFGHDSDKNISVEVKANSSNVNVNKDNLSVSEGNKTINFEYSNAIISINDVLAVGNHTLTISYLGNANYTNSYKIITVQIFGNNTIYTETNVVCNGKNIEIPVRIHDGVDFIEVIKDNFQLTLVYTNETGNISNLTIKNFTVVDGKIKFNETSDHLIAASLIIDYANATEPKTVEIKISTEVKAKADKDQFKSEEIKNISVTILDGQGNLINVTKNDLEVFENGTAVEFTYNNSKISIASISEGAHNLTIVYKGNETYNASSTNAELNVYGKNQITVPTFVVSDGSSITIPISIFNGLENVTVSASDLTLNITYTNETGDVVNKEISFDVENGIITINEIDFELNKTSAIVDYVNSTGAKIVKVNLLTTVEATPASPKYRYNETNNITVKVFSNENPLTISAEDLKVFDNGNEIQFTFNNSNITVSLEQGVHNLTITYKGDETYNSSSETIELKVYGDLRIEPDESVVLDESNYAIIFVNLNDGADIIPIESLSKLNITLFYTVGNQTFNKTYESGIDLLDNKTIKFKVDDDFDSAYVNIVYDNTLTGNTTVIVNTTIVANETLIYGQSEAKNLTVEVKGTNGHVINLTNENIQVLKDGKALNITVNNSVIIINDELKAGIYNLTVKYAGTNTYLASNKTIVVTVYGINATSPINVNSTKKGEVKISIINGNETINITKGDLTLNVTYINGNDTVVIPVTEYDIENGTLTFTLENGNFTSAILNIKYKNTEANVTLNRIYNVNIIPIGASADFQDGNFTFKVVDKDNPDEVLTNKTVSIMMTKDGTNVYFITKTSSGGYNLGTSTTLTIDENGIATLNNTNFYPGLVISDNIYAPIGTYVATVSGSGAIKGSNKTNLTINKIDVNIVLQPFSEYYGTDKKVTITVTNSKTGKTVSGVYIALNITGATLSSPNQVTNGEGSIELGVSVLPTGTYAMSFAANDTNLNNSNGSGSFTIKKIPVVINGKDVTVQFNTGTTYTIKVTKDGKGVSGVYVFVRLYSTSKKYNDYLFQTDKNGKISFSASLAVGKHKIIVALADTRYSAKQITKTIKVKKAKAKIKAKKVTAYYKGGKYFTVKVTNAKKKKPMYDAKVNIKIFVSKNRFYNYTGNTGMNGKLKLSVDGLKPGKYRIEISGADNKNFEAKSITSKIVIKKAPTKLVAKKLKAKKGAKKYFKVTAKNKKTKKPIVGIKLKIKVYTGKKAKTYTVKTKAKGVAKLSTAKLKVGKHKVVIKSANKYCVGKKAKSTIKIKK
jgi:hypothetical protein